MSACKAVANIAGEQYACDLQQPHPGFAHTSQQAHAIWCSDGEARRAINNAQVLKK